MAGRLELHTKLEELLGSKNVYYDPPNNIMMQYDAIRYSLSTPSIQYADNQKYRNMKCYELIVIARRSDPEVVDKILELPYTSPSKSYISDNLYHYPITIYY